MTTTKENSMTDSTAGSDGQHDAQVRTLTAEVRTLVVGSRQVTMSIYSQLDEVDYDEIEPFGRVKPKDAEQAFIYTVGRRRDAHDLVRSRVPREPWTADRDGAVPRYPNVSTGERIAFRAWRGGSSDERQQLKETMLAWAELPLIVLAGLR